MVRQRWDGTLRREVGDWRGIPVFRVQEDVLDAILPVLMLWNRRPFVESVGDEGWLSGLLRLGQCHDGLDDGFYV